MKLFYKVLFLLLCIACEDNSRINNDCRFLLNQDINHTENLNLVPLNGLSTGSAIVLDVPNTRGIIVSNAGNGTYLAFDAADPNHAFQNCSVLSVNYPIGTCNCEDGNRFSLLDGAPIGNEDLLCPLIMYRVNVSGNSLTIFN